MVQGRRNWSHKHLKSPAKDAKLQRGREQERKTLTLDSFLDAADVINKRYVTFGGETMMEDRMEVSDEATEGRRR